MTCTIRAYSECVTLHSYSPLSLALRARSSCWWRLLLASTARAFMGHSYYLFIYSRVVYIVLGRVALPLTYSSITRINNPRIRITLIYSTYVPEKTSCLFRFFDTCSCISPPLLLFDFSLQLGAKLGVSSGTHSASAHRSV